jgi:hypothetical protein
MQSKQQSNCHLLLISGNNALFFLIVFPLIIFYLPYKGILFTLHHVPIGKPRATIEVYLSLISRFGTISILKERLCPKYRITRARNLLLGLFILLESPSVTMIFLCSSKTMPWSPWKMSKKFFCKSFPR